MRDKTALSIGVRSGRGTGVLVLALTLVLAVSGCFGGKPAAEQAQDSLAKGLQAHQAGRPDEALKQYKDVLEKDPTNKWAHYNIGQIEQARGKSSVAEAEYRAALSVDPKMEFALFNLAIIRNTAGAKQEAVDLYRRVLNVNANNAPAHLNLGFALLDLQRREEGERELRRAVDLDPTLRSRVPDSIFE
jgi:tetratricopeptide (TPR) repeat protein